MALLIYDLQITTAQYGTFAAAALWALASLPHHIYPSVSL